MMADLSAERVDSYTSQPDRWVEIYPSCAIDTAIGLGGDLQRRPRSTSQGKEPSEECSPKESYQGYDQWNGATHVSALDRLAACGVSGSLCALNRGETINAVWLVIAAVYVYLIAYRCYSLFIANKVLQLDPSRATPAVRHNDGLDYVPTNQYVLFGHHFAAIAGAGPPPFARAQIPLIISALSLGARAEDQHLRLPVICKQPNRKRMRWRGFSVIWAYCHSRWQPYLRTFFRSLLSDESFGFGHLNDARKLLLIVMSGFLRIEFERHVALRSR